MRAYKGSFSKKNGEIRNMVFVKLEDIDSYNSEFISNRLTGTGSDRKTNPNMELVWDLENDGFRYFNFASQIGDLEEVSVDDSIFV